LRIGYDASDWAVMSGTEKMRVPEALRPLVRSIEALERDPQGLLRAPETAMRRAFEKAKQEWEVLASGDPDWLANMVRETFVHTPMPDANTLREQIRKRQERENRDPIKAYFLGLLHEAHKNFPNSPLVLLAHPDGVGRSTLRSASALQRLVRTRGEMRAQLAIEAIGCVSEAVYRPYVAKLWALWHLANGRISRPPLEFGATVQQLARRVNEEVLVDPLAGRLRNASRHEQYRWLREPGAIHVWNRDGWEAVFRVQELVAAARQMHVVATDLCTVLNEFCSETLLLAFLPLFPRIPALLSGNMTDGERDEMARLEAACRASLAISPEVRALRGLGEDPRLSESIS
jgi:hypothetical protein